MSATTFPQNSADPKLDVTLPLGTHILQLVVRDDVGTESAPDTVVIHVMPQPPETMITHITPNEGRRGDTIDAAIHGKGLRNADVVNVYQGEHEDKRTHVYIRPGGTDEVLPVTIKIPDHTHTGVRTFEVITPQGIDTVAFTIVPAEEPVILNIRPAWGVVGTRQPTAIRIEGEHLRHTRSVEFLRDDAEDEAIVANVRDANDEFLAVDVNIAVDAEFGARACHVTTPAGETVSPPGVRFSVLPGYVQVGIMVTTLITAVIHVLAPFVTATPWPPTVYVVGGLGYGVLLIALYLPTKWLFADTHPVLRWILMGYALLSIVLWAVAGDWQPLAYVDKVVEALLIALLFVESRQPASKKLP